MSVKQHLLDKRDELMWALSLQDYRIIDIAHIFNIKHRSTVMRILARKPEGWVPRWIKRTDVV